MSTSSFLLTMLLVVSGFVAPASAQRSESVDAETYRLEYTEGWSTEALNGSNKLLRKDDEFVILTEIPVGQINPPQASTAQSSGDRSTLIEYQVGTLDDVPLFVLVDVPALDYGGLSSRIFERPAVEADFDRLLQTAADATHAEAKMCSGERRCVETCLVGGRPACCKYKCT